jgi:hypothetical protein
LEQVGALVKAGGDGSGQTAEAFDGRGELVVGDAGVLVEGVLALATAAAVVVGTRVAEGSEQADQSALGVVVVGGGAVAVGAGYTGAFIAIFF